MAISAKPVRKTDAQVMDFIEKGGSVPTVVQKAPNGKGAQHPLKFPEAALFDRLEKARGGAVKLPRNTWVLQAIAEKLEREGF